MAAATAVMCVFYAGLLQCVSELAATWPSAGGLGTYVRLAFGDWLGGFVGISMAVALTACTGAVASFIVSYAGTTGVSSTSIKLGLFAAVVFLNLRGVKDALWLTLVAGLVAVITLLGFSAGVLPVFHASNLNLAGSPLSFAGILRAIPFALWLYVGVEQTVTASEETKKNSDIPRGVMVALAILSLTAFAILFAAPGAGGVTSIATAGDPLLKAIPIHNGQTSVLATLIRCGALFGLLASLFSVTYSASRQTFDLARGGFFPHCVTQINTRGTPVLALLIVAGGGLGISFVNPERVLVGVVLLFTCSYVLTAAAFLRLRITQAADYRPYRAFGGRLTALLTLVLSAGIFVCCFKLDVVTLDVIAAVLIVPMLYRGWGLLRARTVPGVAQD